MESLPSELRCEIYAQCVNIRAYGLMYVNKQFYNEIRPLLKEDFVLGFHIDPSSSTEVKLISPNNSAWGGQWVLDAASTHTDYSFINRMPLDHFKGIRILIDPPSLNDPGQVVRGWLQSIKLVNALLLDWNTPDLIPKAEEDVWLPHTRLSNRLPPITIQVRETKTVKWHRRGS
ncbi:hypothetical protein LTR84_011714 [Exophiala bonariae]|uniref:F-box domain-containing protein n=1 Tax=Exophiala bonariae TaxID=1690606 RepID=A0AAV9NKE8_9EURO|nr:hypothetical protein LTR84_011714 [Exophiala bonariae]